MADFYLKRGDTAPSLQATLTEFDGTNDVVIDLTGATVVFNMVTVGGVIAIRRKPATILIPINGSVQYDWDANETNVAGIYKAEFEATLASGRVLTFPNTDSIIVQIQEDLA